MKAYCSTCWQETEHKHNKITRTRPDWSIYRECQECKTMNRMKGMNYRTPKYIMLGVHISNPALDTEIEVLH